MPSSLKQLTIKRNAIITRDSGLYFELRDLQARGGGGYLTKFNMVRLCLEDQPLTLLHTILAEKVPLLYTFY